MYFATIGIKFCRNNVNNRVFACNWLEIDHGQCKHYVISPEKYTLFVFKHLQGQTG